MFISIYQVSLDVKLARVLGSNKVVEGFDSLMQQRLSVWVLSKKVELPIKIPCTFHNHDMVWYLQFFMMQFIVN